MKKLLWLILCFVALPAAALDGAQILQKVDRNLEPESYEMYRKLIDIQPDGSKKEYVLYTMKKGRDKIVALFLSPPSDKGRVTLRLGDNMWLYIPDVGRSIRITSLQSVTGSVFNNADILRIDYTAEYNVDKAEEQNDGYLLSLKAKTDQVAYDRLKMLVDKQAMLRQLKIRGCTERKKLLWHQKLLNDEMPLSIGGGIGQSRLCMYFLRKAHVGEIQASLWPDEMVATCRQHNIPLL